MDEWDQSIIHNQWYSKNGHTPWVDSGMPAWWNDEDDATAIKVESERDPTPLRLSETAKGKRRQEVDDAESSAEEPERRPAKRPKASAPTEAPRDRVECPRCIKLGRLCLHEPGRPCEPCRKSKVKCPLFNGQRAMSRAPTVEPSSVKREKREGTVGPTDSTAGTSRARTPIEFDPDKLRNAEWAFAKSTRPPPAPRPRLACMSARPRPPLEEASSSTSARRRPPSARQVEATPKPLKSTAKTPQSPKPGSRKSARAEAKAQRSEEVPGAAGSASRTKGMSTVCYIASSLTNTAQRPLHCDPSRHRLPSSGEGG